MRRPLLLLLLLTAPVPAWGGTGPSSALGAITDLEWRYVSKSSALQWSAPGGAVGYEVCASDDPLVACDFSDATSVSFFQTTPPRAPGIVELRELAERDVECDRDEDCRAGIVCDDGVCADARCETDDDCTVGTCEIDVCERDLLDTGLYFTVRAVDESGNPFPATTVDGFDVSSVSAKTVGKERDQSRLVVKGRFPVKYGALDLPGPDVRVRLLQGDVTLLDVTVPGADLRRVDGQLRFRDKDGALARMTLGAGRRSLITIKTAKLDLLVDCPVPVDAECALPFQVLVDVGERPFDDTVVLRRKSERRLVHP